MAVNPNNKVFVVNEGINTQYGGVDPTGEFVAVSELSGGGSSYKVFTAKISQSGTNDPILNILENTTGFDIVFSRTNTGSYDTTLAVDYNKVTMSCTPGAALPVGICIFSQVGYGGPNVTALSLRTYANYAGAYISEAGPNDFLLGEAFLEIRVYN